MVINDYKVIYLGEMSRIDPVYSPNKRTIFVLTFFLSFFLKLLLLGFLKLLLPFGRNRQLQYFECLTANTNKDTK